jgi:hypothetical protein
MHHTFTHGHNVGDQDHEHRATGDYDEFDDTLPTPQDLADPDDSWTPPEPQPRPVRTLEDLTTQAQRDTLARLVAGGARHGLCFGDLEGALKVGTGGSSYKIHPDGRLERWNTTNLTWETT